MNDKNLPDIPGLSADELAILTYLFEQEGIAVPGRQTIFPREQRADLPLSFAQERLWFLDQWDPGNPAYNIFFAVRIEGRLKLAALQRSLDEIVRRHEALRTIFPATEGRPVQVIVPPLRAALPLIDLQGIPAAEQKAHVSRLANAEARYSFDLGRGPLMRAGLLRLADEAHVFLLNMHHIIFDGWSFNLFIGEMAALYTAFSNGKPSPLADLPIQYADFALWQRRWLQGEVLETQLAYWREQLRGPLPVLAMPTDRPRPAVQTSNGALLSLVLPRPLVEALKGFSKREGATLFMTMLAAFTTLLFRYNGQDDIVVGSPIANRDLVEVENLIGFLVNTLLLRANLSGDPAFRTLLGRVRDMAIQAYAHQNVPFEQLVDELQPERDPSHPPLFQVLFLYEETSTQTYEFPNLTLKLLEVQGGTAKFDLTLTISLYQTDTVASVEYNTDLYDAATVRRMLGYFETLLKSIAADPDRRLSDLPIMTDAERRQLLGDGSQELAVGNQQICLHELIAEQAARTPDAVAVAFDPVKDEGRKTDESSAASFHLSYGALEARANRLAHYLRRMGVGPEQLVGIYMARSPELIIAILGVLKAGGAYVPLDPNYPAERRRFMLEDSRATTLVTNDQGPRTKDRRRTTKDQSAATNNEEADAPFVFCPSSLVDLAADWDAIAALPADAPAALAGPANLAYAIYTSGSTGQAKGVMIAHRSLAGAARAWERDYALGREDCHLQMASFSFDVFAGDLARALCFGGKLLMAPRDLLLDPPKLYELMDRQRATCAEFVPATLRALMTYLEQQNRRLDQLRLLICGSDIWYMSEYRRFRRSCAPTTRLINSFGLTEATIDSAWYETTTPAEAGDQAVPIGRPLANTRLYILDNHMQPPPIGAAGQLYIGGSGLARGYLGRPDLTAAAFLPNPFTQGSGVSGQGSDPDPRTPNPNPRLYRTGDVARYRSDGAIEFLGRADSQVKLRGFRIELGEIEATLGRHPAVRQAVVLARDERLVAYVVPNGEDSRLKIEDSDADAPTALASIRYSLSAELRAFLAERLPDYMLPSAFVALDALPLTPNGKINRRALPAPDASSPALGAALVAPRTPVEEVVAQIWSAVLGLEQVDILANFFELGGHSLLGAQVIARLREAFQVELPLRALFETPTVAGLAEQIATALRSAQGLRLPPLRRAERHAEAPLSFAQQRLWFLDQLQPGSSAYNIPIALRMSGALDVAALRRSLSAITRRHEVLRTTISATSAADGSAPMQLIAPARALPLPLIDLQSLPADARDAAALRLANTEAQRPFDLARGPLIRALLLRSDAGEHIALLVLHHIVADGWSIGVLVRELTTLYAADRAGHPADLPALPLQYADYAIWQRAWLAGAPAPGQPTPLHAQRAYWRAQLAALPPLDLQPDRPRPSAPTFRGAHHAFALDDALGGALAALAQRTGSTRFMLLLAAFQTLLARRAGQYDLAVGADVANRAHLETEPLIGFFVNQLVLRADLRGDPPFTAALRRVRQTALDAYAHQDLPFELLVAALAPARDLRLHPLFQVSVTLQHAPAAALALPGLTLRPLALDQPSATFDLTLALDLTPAGIQGALAYSADLFDGPTIQRLAAQYCTLLAGIAAAPDARLSDLPILTPPERQQLLVEWTAAPAPPDPPDAGLHQIVARQAARTPDAIAAICADAQLSYAALDRRASWLAAALRARGVRAEDAVGLRVDRSLDLAVGLLGILKAGAAVLPLDPAIPPPRQALMLRESGARALVTRDTEKRTPAESPGWRADSAAIVDLGADWPARARAGAADPAGGVDPRGVAYLIYTSGSTGAPKGVQLTHAALTRYVAAVAPHLDLRPSDRVLQFAALSFDVLIEELFPAWARGAAVVFSPAGLLAPADAFGRLLDRQRVTALELPAAYWQAWVDALRCAGSAAPRGLRLVLLGCEQPDPARLAYWRTLGVPLVYVFGLTETAITSTLHRADPHAGDLRWPLPIGRALAHAQCYVLDAQMQPVPIGAAGELYIGGAGLARGYLARPDLTAARFIPNPFAQGAGGWGLGAAPAPRTRNPEPRVYRTGDRARWRADGALEFLGRLDDQLKLRGYRIEPGEIAAALRAHPAVRAAVVVARADGGEVRLVAYLVPEPGGQGPGAEDRASARPLPDARALIPALRAFLAARLPDYMIPAAFVALDALPLTPNGKIDQQALPAPARPDVPDGAFIAPRSDAELQLARIWEDVLGAAPIGVHDNFFELGGHSLLAIRLVARVEAQLGLAVPLTALFQRPTIAQMAPLLGGSAPIAAESPLVALQPEGARPPLFLVHPAGGDVLSYYLLAQKIGREQPVYGLRASGLEGEAAPRDRVEALAAGYIAALRAVQPRGPYRLAGWSLGGLIAFEIARQLSAQGHEVELLALIDSWASGYPDPGGADDPDDLALLESFAAELAQGRAADLGVTDEDLQRLAPEARLGFLIERARALEIVPPEVGAEQLRHRLKVFKANLRAAHSYSPGGFAGRVVLLRAAEGAPRAADSTLGWQRHVSEPIAVLSAPGDHYSMFGPSHVAALAELLRACLEHEQPAAART